MRKKIKYVRARDRVNLSAGDTIKELCKLNELSQSELAKRSGIKASNLSDIINGKRTIGRAVAERLSKALNVSPGVILFAGETPRQGSQVDALIKQAIQTVEEIKIEESTNKKVISQLDAVKITMEAIAKIFTSSNCAPKIAPIDLVARNRMHSNSVYAKRHR